MNSPSGLDRLPEAPRVTDALLERVAGDYERFARAGLPPRLEDYLLDEYRLDVATTYAGLPIPNPWGKASGQLSMTGRQVQEDVDGGLGFVVLKTVIAQDASGAQSMHAWAIREARMVAERIVGQSGEEGWTISWKGRGWWQSFDEYLELIRDAQRIARGTGTLIVPSCKYHLPTPDESDWKVAEYEYTTRRLLEAWHDGWLGQSEGWLGQSAAVPQQRTTRNPGASQSLSPSHPPPPLATRSPMPLEKDFSPTLAGSDRAVQQAKILEWMRTVPRLIRESAAASAVPTPTRRTEFHSVGDPGDAHIPGEALEPRATSFGTGGRSGTPSYGPVRVGLKIFNAMFDDAFQLEMLRTIHEPGPGRPDFFVYANRLFDPSREFDGHRGIAYGGPDLSDRNLRVMTRFAAAGGPPAAASDEPVAAGGPPAAEAGDASDAKQPPDGTPITRCGMEWSATGNITTGKMALEYALRGATSFQLHTFFQLPTDQYAMTSGSRTQRALLELYFHPRTGFVVWMHHLAAALGLPGDRVRFVDVAGRLERIAGDAPASR
ncbi:MAG TPA: hypothetical protein VML55_19610 [Planctomycetaceae bacterium]|nr:hypothetical protein [Planctomycetaceae bacterium]